MSFRVINMSDHREWGDRISWFDYKERKIDGHMTPRPRIGDRIVCEMETSDSNRQFRIFVITGMEYMTDPEDQFFEEVKDYGYIIRTESKELRFELNRICPLCNKKFKDNYQKMLKHIEKKHMEEIRGN